MTTAVFANYPLQQPNSVSTPLHYGLYDALSRVAFSSAVCYIIFACIQQSGGPVNTILSHRLWRPLSKLSYAIYMVNFSVIIVTMASAKTPPYFSELSAFHSFIGNYVLSLFIAIIGMLAFEKPFVIIDSLVFSSEKSEGECNVRTNVPVEQIKNKDA